MIRFAWTQSRTQTLVGAAALAIVAVVLAVTGLHLVHLYDSSVARCAVAGDCSAARASLLLHDGTMQAWLSALVIVVPGIAGIFWGAPLVAHELESGTHRLAWTQTVTRTRWTAIKLGVGGLAAMAAAGLFSLMVTWWASPLDTAGMNAFGSFDSRDIVPVGYAAFALALGAFLGAVIRRTVPAMAATLVAFTAARLSFVHLVRPHLLAPVVRNLALNPVSTGIGASSTNGGAPTVTLQPTVPDIPNAWIVSTQVVDKAGHSLTPQIFAKDCPGLGHFAAPKPGLSHVPAPTQNAVQSCVDRVGMTYHEMLTYQPAYRYWELQWYEMAVFLAAALVLAGACVWWVRRRTA
ncbi:MAG: transporter [Acidimicrobiales bacterium]